MATMRLAQGLRRSDLGLITAVMALVLIGLAALFSFSMSGDASSRLSLVRQAGFALVGLGAVLVLIRLDFRFLTGIHWVLYGLGNLALVAVLIFGQTVRGTTGWFAVGPIQLQPVEFVKIIMAVVMARIMADSIGAARTWSYILRSGLVVAIPVALVMAQPDFGSAAVLLAIWVVMLLVVPVPRRRLLVVGLAGALLAAVAWIAVLRPYQKERVLTFLNPTRDALGAGYNVRQSLAAIGSGQLFGRGLGLGPQSQLNFLPERQTDFIFASISEELGFLGGGLVIVLYGVYFYRLVRILDRTQEPVTNLLVVGLGSITLVHVLVNIGMNLGMLPVTGIPLPFVSYGGSALLASFLGLGLIESVAARSGSRVS